MVSQASIPSLEKDNEPEKHSGIGKHGQKNPNRQMGDWQSKSMTWGFTGVRVSAARRAVTCRGV